MSKLKIKLVFTTHGAEVLLLNNIKLINKILINFVLKNTYKFTANSEVTLNQIKNNCEPDYINNKYEVIPMGIQDKFFEVNNLEFKKDNHFLYVGRLIDYKGVNLLLKCLSEVETLCKCFCNPCRQTNNDLGKSFREIKRSATFTGVILSLNTCLYISNADNDRNTVTQK